MASRADIEFTYTSIDRIFRLSLGELADFSGAKYDGDFSLTLEEAQRRKHEYIAEQIGIGPGRRLLDLGCGWGALLELRPPPRRARASAWRCRPRRSRPAAGTASTCTSGMRARSTGDTYGPFDAVASLGAFEHFCSPEDYRAGRQEEIYRELFANAASVLPSGGRFYLQTMVFGRNMIPLEEVDVHAPRDSDAWILALLGCQFPGSWLPTGLEQIVRCAEPHFRLVESSSGRLDYIETITQWGKRTGAPSLRKNLLKLRLLPRWLTEPRVPLRLHLGRQRQQGLLRARAARPLPDGVREGGVTRRGAPAVGFMGPPRAPGDA